MNSERNSRLTVITHDATMSVNSSMPRLRTWRCSLGPRPGNASPLTDVEGQDREIRDLFWWICIEARGTPSWLSHDKQIECGRTKQR